MSFVATWMDLEIIILSEVRKRKTNTVRYHLHVESKIWYKSIYLRNKNRLTDTDNRLVVAKGGGGGGKEWEFGMSRGRLLYREWINNKVLLYSTENYWYIQYSVINHNGKEYEKEYIGLPWWCSGWESACQCRGHGFEPWSGKIPHAVEQLGLWATTTEPAHLEPMLRNKRGRDSERPAHRNEEWPPLAATGESPRTETKTQHSQK